MLDAINELAKAVKNPTRLYMGRRIYEEFSKTFKPSMVGGEPITDFSLLTVTTDNGELEVEVVDEDIIAIR